MLRGAAFLEIALRLARKDGLLSKDLPSRISTKHREKSDENDKYSHKRIESH